MPQRNSGLLRASAVEPGTPNKQRDIAEIRGLRIVAGDLVRRSLDALAEVFAQYDTVIGCVGYAVGIDTPMKLAWRCLAGAYPEVLPMAVRG